jgi:hypothetical protein
LVNPLDVLDELSSLEPIFHRQDFLNGRSALESMLAPDFWEVGASGRIYDREFAIETVLQRGESTETHAWPCRDFRLRQLGPHSYLITYTLEQPARTTRRATIWEKSEEGWRVVYHQGTQVE